MALAWDRWGVLFSRTTGDSGVVIFFEWCPSVVVPSVRRMVWNLIGASCRYCVPPPFDRGRRG